MQLLRIVTAVFDPDPKQPKSWELVFGDVVLETHKLDGEEDRKWKVLLTAKTTIECPQRDDEELISIPEQPRQILEASIESVGNFISVLGHCKRFISSATPSVALIADSKEEAVFLQNTKGIRTSQQAISSASCNTEFDAHLLQNLTDRLPALALLAEANSHTLAAGKFHEFVRVFESAFALPFSQLTKKLLQFLNPVYGYSKEELDTWTRHRDPLTHADGKKSNEIYLDSDVRRYTQRMQQAAYDVLFNKEVWSDRSSRRRDIWTPHAASTSPTGDIVIRRGSAPSIQFQVLDEFAVFPKDLNATLNDTPQEWWYKSPDNQITYDASTLQVNNSESGPK